jgi:hypothetical protein
MVAKKDAPPAIIEVPETVIGQVQIGIIGITPLLHNRMAEKARHELLLPKGRKNAAERASTLKHDPVEEFRSSIYRLPEDDAPTMVATMGSMFKGAMMTAALDLPGSNKSQIGRLVVVQGHYLPLWGSLQMHMGITRSADMAKTPDVRTRGISPKWGTVLMINYVQPLMTEKAVVNLLVTAGRSAGIGDWRPQKGKGTFGQFRVLATPNEPELEELMEEYGRDVQIQALEDAEPFDAESAELLTWYDTERKNRGR